MDPLKNPEIGRLLFLSHPQPMWVYDLETLAFLDVNVAAMEHYGYSREEFLAMTIRDIRPVEEIPRLLQNISRVSAGIDRAGVWHHRKKDGQIIAVEITSHTLSWEGRKAELVWAQDVTARMTAEARLQSINHALLHLGSDFQANIHALTHLCGELLGATCALYNRLHSGLLCSFGQWNTPSDYNPTDKPEGHICYDVIQSPGTEVLIVRHLQDTHYARTDPNVTRYNLQTYIGQGVRLGEATVGSLCVVFQKDVIPTEDDKHILSIIATAIATEEARQKAEATLREREEKYQQLFELESDAIFLIDNESGQILEGNKAAEQMYGFSHQELIAMKNTDLSAEPDLTNKATRANPPSGTVVNIPLRWHRKKDGTVFPIEITGRFFSLNGCGVHIAAIRDISGRRKDEEKLRESEELLRTLINSMPDIVCFKDGQGRWLLANDFDLNLFQLTGVSYQGMKDSDLAAFSPFYREAFLTCEYSDEQAWKAGKPSRADEMIPRPGGLPLTFDIVKVPTFFPDGRRRGLVVIGRDITERKALEEQLRHAQKMESVGRLAGGVAHDFNNMLMVILGHAELVLARIPELSPIRNDLIQIQSVARRSADLTRQLLAFARKQTIAPKVLDLNDIVSGMLRMLQRLIGEDVQLHWIPGANLWNIRMDPAQIDQILANLVVNSRDAMSEQGVISLETRNYSLPAPDLRQHPELKTGSYVVLSISDSGVGMTPEVMQHMFDPFFTTKEVGKGTGLGLATVYGIVSQNGGVIEVESEVGKGTSFRLYFPRDLSHEQTPPATTDVSHLPTGTETILLVEDEMAILDLVQALLRKLGYTVIPFSRPDKALQHAADDSATMDLLLADVVMPGMNGRELFHRLQQIRPGLRSLFMSGYTSDVIASRGVLDEGCQFVQKPFQIDELARKIREILDQKA